MIHDHDRCTNYLFLIYLFIYLFIFIIIILKFLFLFFFFFLETEFRSGRGEARRGASLWKPQHRLLKPHSNAQSPVPFRDLELMPSIALGFSPFRSFYRRNPTQRLAAVEDWGCAGAGKSVPYFC